MTTRRNFLKTGGLSLASLMVGQHSFARMAEKADDKLAGAASTTQYVCKRPVPSKRQFTSEAVEKAIATTKAKLKDPKLAWMFENCFPNTLDTTCEHKMVNGKPDTFVLTGDIHAMWLRDSSAQVFPHIQFANDDPKVKTMLAGVINRQTWCINIDPYANGFNEGPTGSEWESDFTDMKKELHERKWEIDSLCYPIRLAYHYWKTTGDASIFSDEWLTAIAKVLKTFKEQQRKEDPKGPYRFQRKTERALDTMTNDGWGNPVKPVGLIASAFRPSDDATTFQFLVPSNFFAVTSLRKAAEMGYKQFAYLPLFQEDAAKTAGPFILPSDKREIAMLTTQFLSSSHFSSTMLDRFQSEINHLHSGMTIHRISPIELKEKKLPSSLNIQRTAGIICFEVFDYDYAQMLCDLDLPLLFVDSPVMNMRPPLKADRLYMENRIEIQNAVTHMVQRGKKRISFAGDKNHCQSFFERYMAYRDAVEHFGLTEGLSTCAMPSGQQNYPVSLYETIRRFKTMPDAFVCANDFVAMDLVKALNELGYSVPDDIWVCGFDDSQEASYFAPRLTSIHIHGQIMGYTAANLLMTRIEEPSLNYRTVYTETNLILRESTGD